MDQAMLWVTIFGVIVIPVVGWIFNTLITNKIDSLNKKCDDLEGSRKEERELFFGRLDALKVIISTDYVRKDLYDQSMNFHQKEVDSKFNNLIDSMNKNFQSVETDIKDVKGDIKEIKDLINAKLNSKKQGE